MAVIEGGASAVVAEVGAIAQKGIHVLTKPIDAGALGHYRVSVSTGTLAAALAANSQLFQFKWTDATRLAVITSIEAKFETLTRFTAGTITDFGVDAFMVRTYAAGGGGTTLTKTGDNMALRASFGATLVGDINVSTTAALTAATTLDTQPFAQGIGQFPLQIVPSATIQAMDGREPILNYRPRMADGEYPLTLAQNEGFVIRNRTVWPAAGTGIWSFMVQWAEVTAF